MPSATFPSVTLHDPRAGQCTAAFLRAAIAFLLELRFFYPRRPMVFLARDMEYHFAIHDALVAAGALSGPPGRLIHATRASVAAPAFREYVRQVVPDDALLVDTGFFGTVIKHVAEAHPAATLRGHLLCSLDGRFPQSEFSLAHLAASTPRGRHGRRALVKTHIEHLPHRFQKAAGYRQVAGRIEPALAMGDDIWVGASVEFEASLRAGLRDPRMVGWIARMQGLFSELGQFLDFRPARRLVVQLPAALRPSLTGPAPPSGLANFLTLVERMGAAGDVALRFGDDAATPIACDSKVLRIDAPAGDSDAAFHAASRRLLATDRRSIDVSLVSRLRRTQRGRGLLHDCLRGLSTHTLERPLHEDRVAAFWSACLRSD